MPIIFFCILGKLQIDFVEGVFTLILTQHRYFIVKCKYINYDVKERNQERNISILRTWIRELFRHKNWGWIFLSRWFEVQKRMDRERKKKKTRWSTNMREWPILRLKTTGKQGFEIQWMFIVYQFHWSTSFYYIKMSRLLARDCWEGQRYKIYILPKKNIRIDSLVN